MNRHVGFLGVVLLLVASGVVHGLLSDRWTNRTETLVAEARARLDAVPLHIGPWTGTDRSWTEFDERENNDKNVTRQYVNALNGNAVGLLLSAGQSRNLWLWHTPLDCYPANGYEQAAVRSTITIPVEQGVDAEFFHTDFTLPRGSAPLHVRVFWAWSGNGRWQAPDHPKLSFGKFPALYKVYVLRTLLRRDEPLEGDPCVDFLKVVVPQLNQTFFPPAE